MTRDTGLMTTFKSGYIALLGQPNVGKSTLLNKIIGETVAIVSPKPQTTRNRVVGILNRKTSQLVFVDTPGYHSIPKALNQYMLGVIERTIQDSDLFCWLMDAEPFDSDLDFQLWERLKGKESIAIVNKADLLSPDERNVLANQLRNRFDLKELFFISALNGDGIEELVTELEERMPEGKALFPDDIYTDLPIRFLVAEAIREQTLMLLRQEIPYGIAVEILSFDEKPEITVIKANIIVEKNGHKGIVVGKKGAMIKKIGTRAREKIEFLLQDQKVFLELFVRVEPDWTRNPSKMAELGYS